MKRIISATLAAALLLGIAGPVTAAPASITLDQAAPSFGDQVTFTWSSNRAESIQLQCSQSGFLVFADGQLVRNDPVFTLGPSLAWKGGAADCTALLGHRARSGRYMVEATVEFGVGA